MMRFLLFLFFLLMAVASDASGEVTTSNSYYTNGVAIHEDTTIKNANYVNSISISPSAVASASTILDAGTEDEGTESILEDSIALQSMNGDAWAHINAQSDDFKVSRQFLAGVSGEGPVNLVAFNYFLGGGTSATGCGNPHTHAVENIVMDNNSYYGGISATGDSLDMHNAGYGSSSNETPFSSFDYAMTLYHLGRFGAIESDLTCDRFEEVEDGVPQSYYLWKSDVSSNGRVAKSSFSMNVAAGDADTDAQLWGYSSELADKSAGPIQVDHVIINDTENRVDLEEYDYISKLVNDPDFTNLLKIVKQSSVTQKLYMSYEITPP